MTTPDDFGIAPTNLPDVEVLWERRGDTLSWVTVDDAPPAVGIPLPPGAQQYVDEAARSGGLRLWWTGWIR